MQGRTQKVGDKTSSHTRRLSAINIQNRDPNFDYSFRRKKEVEDGGGQDIYGYVPIGESNSNGETLGAYPVLQRTKGSKQLVYLDTIACKRPKEVGQFFKAEEDERYNAQVRHVQTSAKKTRHALRSLDPDSVVKDDGSYGGPGMTQRKGPTQEK